MDVLFFSDQEEKVEVKKIKQEFFSDQDEKLEVKQEVLQQEEVSLVVESVKQKKQKKAKRIKASAPLVEKETKGAKEDTDGKPAKHKKRKGWKGWALVEEDAIEADVLVQEEDATAGIRKSKRKRE
ncbi:hypothetical protein DFH28DRAFT_1106539 [Melampsora americana]|nr:hypothetical protein DFH28DRAFT_1106539 [Melampsora americana]